MTKRNSFTREFKLEAVRLLELGDKEASVLARELGVPRNRLYKWRDEIKKHDVAAFPGKGRRSGNAAELARLKAENERLREENDILKKAARFFARES
jgi:transposase-like protein